MAHYWTIHKYCQPELPSLFFTACLLLSLNTPRQRLPLPANKVSKEFLQVQKRPNSLPHDEPSSVHILHLDLKQRQEKIK